MLYQRLSPTQWQWQVDDKSYEVRLFAHTGTLIWSTWTTSGGTPQVEPGTTQIFESFIAHGAPSAYHPPEALTKEVLQEVQEARKKSKKKRNLKDWLM
ncbi:MAG: hypothetical protein U0694_08770 [Anaerolineae bacterium]